ncbi:MAG: hypothetical protein M5U26_29835 [Planctomycetota bacterium]|nr:hypothetical protein [Planctomycetota bacterium]
MLDNTSFEARWARAAEALDGPEPGADAARARLDLWRRQEWHDWFRWRLCARGFDWSKPLWFAVLAGGLFGLVYYGALSGRWEVTAGGVVAWFTLVNLGFFVYLGLRTRQPPPPHPGPFAPGVEVRAEAALYPAGYDGRTLPRLLLRVPRRGAESPWLLELPFSSAQPLPLEFAELIARQATFRMQRGDAPKLRAVCQAATALTRAEIDAGAHPLMVVAWVWDEQRVETFGRGAT